MPNMPRISREQMWIVLGVLAVIAILAALKVELTAYFGFAGLLLVGIGVIHSTTTGASTKSDVAEVKTQVNGNNQRLVSAALIAMAYVPAERAAEILNQLGITGALPAAVPPPGPVSIPVPREPLDVEAIPIE